MRKNVFDVVNWFFDSIEYIVEKLIEGMGKLHQNNLRLVSTYPVQATFFLEILVIFLLFLIVFTLTRKQKAAAPEAAKLSKTNVSWQTNWKAIGIAIGVALALIAVVGVVK